MSQPSSQNFHLICPQRRGGLTYNGLLKKQNQGQKVELGTFKEGGHHIEVFIAVEFPFFRHCVAKEKRATYIGCRAVGSYENPWGSICNPR